MRVLVTGIGGFVGPVLARALLARGHEVHGILRRAPEGRLRDLPVTLHQADVLAADGAGRVVAAVRPDGVAHLAGLSFVPAADADPEAALRGNRDTTLAVLRAVYAHAPAARLLVVSSCAVYGLVDPRDLPVGEDAPLRPVNRYGESKLAAEEIALAFGREHGLDVVRARPFNHTGPGQSSAFVCAGLARQVAAIEAGRQEPVLQVGNVDAVRDFSDVRDIAEGYAALLERGAGGAVYNLCSGVGTSIAEVIATLRAHARVPMWVRADPARRRNADVPRLVGSHARAERELGWRPRIALADTLRDTLEYWRRRVVDEG